MSSAASRATSPSNLSCQRNFLAICYSRPGQSIEKRELIDTNILLYAYDIEACAQRQIAASSFAVCGKPARGGQYAGVRVIDAFFDATILPSG